MNELESNNFFLVSHHPQWSEVFLGLEHANNYSISDIAGQEILFAHEEKGSFLRRFFLQNSRPFVINVIDRQQNLIFKIEKPFRFIWHECTVIGNSGEILGKVNMRWALFAKKYEVVDATEQVLSTLHSPFFKPWTYYINRLDNQIGLITKKWAGFKKEFFSTADNFGLQLDAPTTAKEKSLLLSAVFLIDFMHFEKKN